MKNERDVKKVVRNVLDDAGPQVWYFMPVASGYGRSGIPDFIGIAYGVGFGIETKFGDNKPTMHQTNELEAIRKAVGVAVVIDEIDTEGRVLELVDKCLSIALKR